MGDKKFNIDDIKPGYVVRFGNDELRSVVRVGKKGTLILVDVNGKWDYLSRWNYDLTANVYVCINPYSKEGRKVLKGLEIVEVYGLVTDTHLYCWSHAISTAGRDLLWKRNPTVKMTLSEISEKLGYDVEIVPEDDKE